MYGAGNPQMAALGALGALGGSLRNMVMAPVSNWSQASLTHKIIAAGAGAGLAYYLHQRGMADVAVAAAGIGGAYATSMLMHYRQNMAAQANGGILPNGQPAAALSPAHVQDMAAQAAAVMNSAGNGSNGVVGVVNDGSRWGALGPAASSVAPSQNPQPPSVASPPVTTDAGTGVGESKWAALG